MGLYPIAEGAAWAVVALISQLVPIMEPPALAVPWPLCQELGVLLLSFEIHMAPREPEISLVSSSTSPAFLLIDRKEGSKVLSQPQ